MPYSVGSMAPAIDLTQPDNWIPEDSFGARLALIRQHMSWNVAEAARACGFNDETWRQWERTGRTPRGVYEVAKTIARVTGCSYDWLVLGGELARSKWTALGDLRLIPGGASDLTRKGQMALPFLSPVADTR